MMPMRLEPAAPQSQIKHSTTVLPLDSVIRTKISDGSYILHLVVASKKMFAYTKKNRLKSITNVFLTKWKKKISQQHALY